MVSERGVARACPCSKRTPGNRTTPVWCQRVTRWPICFASLPGRTPGCWCPQITGPAPATASPVEDQMLISHRSRRPLSGLLGRRASSAEKSVPAPDRETKPGRRARLSISARARERPLSRAREDLDKSTEESIKTRTTDDGGFRQGLMGTVCCSLVFLGSAKRKPRPGLCIRARIRGITLHSLFCYIIP